VISNFQGSNASLSDYGKSFQQKLIYCFVSDKEFLNSIYDIVDYELFESFSLQWIVNVIIDYYQEYSELADKDVFKLYIRKDVGLDDVKKIALRDDLIAIYSQVNEISKKLEFIQDEATTYFRNKNMEKALYEMAEKLKANDFSGIQSSFEQAMIAGMDKSLGTDYKANVDHRYSEEARSVISTGYEILDLYLDGGIGLKELGVILAMSSVGKSWVLAHLAVNAAMKGKKVLVYSLEDDENFLGRRIDSILTHISTTELKYHLEAVHKKVAEMEGNIFIKEFPQLVTSTTNFQSHLNSWKMLHGEPDLVIVDYGSIMAPTRYMNQDHLNQKQIFNELKSWVQQNNLRCWTADQANLTADGKEVVESTSTGGAYAKVAPCNIIISLARGRKDKEANTGRFFIAKNKYGPDGITLPAKMDPSKGILRIYNSDTQEGKALTDSMQTDQEYVKDALSKKVKNNKERFKELI
jgi:archaellum biogenesis ATPase FlaH